jgi:O-antigen/teichoic acid export membrane protein
MTSSVVFLLGNVDSFMIGYFLGEKEVGLYSACLKITLVIPFVLESINGFIAPKFATEYVNRNTQELKNLYYGSVKITLSWSVAVFLVIVIFADLLLGLFGSEFVGLIHVLWVVSLTYVISSTFGSIGYLMNLTGSQKIVARVVFGALIINIILNYILIPVYGLIGGAFATLLSTFVWKLILYSYSRKYGILT